PNDSPIVIAKGDLTPDAHVLIQESGFPLLVRRGYGAGTVDYLAADPGVEPYQSWKNRSKFWFSLLTSVDQRPTWSNGISNSSDGTVAANLIKGLRLPDVFQMCGFLLMYIIVIGPLNYLILK